MARANAREELKGDNEHAALSKPRSVSKALAAKGGSKTDAKSQPKCKHEDEATTNENGEAQSNRQVSPSSKKARTTNPKGGSQSYVDRSKLEALLEAYGVLPLTDSTLAHPTEAKPETILALVYLAMLTSARISHQLAYKSVKCLIDAGYHDITTLKKSTWEERTEVLTKGGYTRYREKTATGLGELAELIDEQYNGDLNNLIKKADSSPQEVRTLLQEIKGLGKVGIDIFFDAAQCVWPSLAPFVDPRSLSIAENIGLGKSIEKLWEAVNKDPVEMCKLSSALTMVRLEKKEQDFQ